MIRNLILLSAILVPVLSFSQTPFPQPEEIESFFNTKTLVVLEDQMFSTYNGFIQKSMEEHWDITGYEFITVSEFNEKREDPAYSFLVLTETKFDKDKSGNTYNFLNLLLGKDVGRIEDMPEMCAIPLSAVGEDEFDYSYKVGIVLRFIQSHAKHLSEDPSITGKKYLKYYNKFIPELQNKKILVSEDDLVPELRSKSALAEYYSYEIELAGDGEIQKAIMDKAENTLVLHKVGPEGEREGGMCFKMLIGTDDGRIYFYGEHRITPKSRNGLLINDIKRIGRF